MRINTGNRCAASASSTRTFISAQRDPFELAGYSNLNLNQSMVAGRAQRNLWEVILLEEIGFVRDPARVRLCLRTMLSRPPAKLAHLSPAVRAGTHNAPVASLRKRSNVLSLLIWLFS